MNEKEERENWNSNFSSTCFVCSGINRGMIIME